LNTSTVRLAGRILDWNDAKGFGFVVPNGGGERAFVHVNDFQRGSRRPVDGDLISYLPATDSRGRYKARDIRHAGQRIVPRPQRSRLPRTALGLVALTAIAGAALTGAIAVPLAAACFVASGVACCMYYFDKTAARRGGQRTPENMLHLASLLGGWPGALLAQQRFRHKTAKRSFQMVFWATVVINLGLVGWLLRSGAAARLGMG
jgi:uncharacterized membrane protein YsdA (DUF1294 family)/cold shock CspA family protein